MKHFVIFSLILFVSFEICAQDNSVQGQSNSNESITLEPVTVTAQKREQNILDIPATISTINAQTLENTNIRSLELLSDFVPGLNIRIQTPHRPLFAIRGLTSDEVSLTAQPRVSVFFNNVTTSRANMAVAEIFDMERIEVLKGPQGTLFGRGSQIGALNFISKKPDTNFGGYLSAGFGNYAMKEFEGALNIPVVKDKLAARVSGIYSYQDGYVKNTSGGKNLNGKNTVGGRFSARFTPNENWKIDLVINYQKDDNPGTAFMSKRYPNANGVKDIFQYEVSLDEGKEWYNKREVLGTSLEAQYRINDNNSITSITSYYANSVDHRWDGDGTHAPAIDMKEINSGKQFTQELRYNFTVNERLTGFLGMSYWIEDVKQKYWWGPDERYTAHIAAEIVNSELAKYGLPPLPTPALVSPDGTLVNPSTALPGMYIGSPYYDIPYPTNHEEENKNGAINYACDMFFDATYKILPKLSLTAGIRGSSESLKTSNEAHLVGAVPSTFGMVTQRYPNFLFAESPYKTIRRDYLSFTYRVNLKYDISDFANVWAGYARGRRPDVLQFNSSTGESETVNAEQVHSFDAGFKWNLQQRYWLDLSVFYQKYNDFQTSKWVNAGYLTDDAGMATSYGLEATAKALICSNLDVFGNYSWIHARFDGEDSNGNRQEYAGKTFRLTPEHSFLLGLNAKFGVSDNFKIIFTPTYSWRGHIWFEDSNELQPADPTLDRLEQDAYGLLNANLAFKLVNPGLTLSVFATNLTDTKYVIGAGNTGMMFGVPTYVPGAPRIFGTKLRFSF